jgi:hypothetical protein
MSLLAGDEPRAQETNQPIVEADDHAVDPVAGRRLIDPRNGKTFYIGRGRGNRLFAGVVPRKALTDGIA